MFDLTDMGNRPGHLSGGIGTHIVFGSRTDEVERKILDGWGCEMEPGDSAIQAVRCFELANPKVGGRSQIPTPQDGAIFMRDFMCDFMCEMVKNRIK